VVTRYALTVASVPHTLGVVQINIALSILDEPGRIWRRIVGEKRRTCREAQKRQTDGDRDKRSLV